MAKTWLILLAIFVFFLLVLWKITSGPMKKEYGEKCGGKVPVAYPTGNLSFT